MGSRASARLDFRLNAAFSRPGCLVTKCKWCGDAALIVSTRTLITLDMKILLITLNGLHYRFDPQAQKSLENALKFRRDQFMTSEQEIKCLKGRKDTYFK